jgi:hypothetical protein
VDGISINLNNVYNRAKDEIDGIMERNAEKEKKRENYSAERQKLQAVMSHNVQS